MAWRSWPGRAICLSSRAANRREPSDSPAIFTAGVFFVQQGDTAGTGKLLALGGGDSYTNIVFYGSIYGDIQDLFTHRKYAGDPSANQGSVVIRFDERIILNTPPALTDILQLSESQVAR